MKLERCSAYVAIALASVACQGAWADTALPPAASASAPAGSAPSASTPAASAPAHAVPGYAGRAGNALIAPLGDLNLTRSKIPAVLKEALAAPYAEPQPQCEALVSHIQALDAALGPDLDAPRSRKVGLLERGADQAGKASINMISDTTTGIVPFRGWVRRLTGAERHSKRVAAAITAGSLRRAYLKGYARAQGCPASEPASHAPALSAPVAPEATETPPAVAP